MDKPVLKNKNFLNTSNSRSIKDFSSVSSWNSSNTQNEKVIEIYDRELVKRKRILWFLVILFGIFVSALLALVLIGFSVGKCTFSFTPCVNISNTIPINRNCTYGTILDTDDKCKECGITFNRPNLRIVGGKPAQPHSWPSIVLILHTYRGVYLLNGHFVELSNSKFCSGTLINRNTIVTAAHCLVESTFEYFYNGTLYNLMFKENDAYKTLESTYTAYFGVHEISYNCELNLSQNTLKKSISRIIRHELYDKVNNLHDIAILKLDSPVPLSENVQVACLPFKKTSQFPDTKQTVYVAGWGIIDTKTRKKADKLYNTKLEVFDKSKCVNVLPALEKDWTTQICAGDQNYLSDSCYGDSGAGLFIENNSRYMLVGIVSMGEECAKIRKPGIYTRISYYLDWILAYSDN